MYTCIINIYYVTTISQADDQGTDDVSHSDVPVVTAPTNDDGTNQDMHDSTVCC